MKPEIKAGILAFMNEHGDSSEGVMVLSIDKEGQVAFAAMCTRPTELMAMVYIARRNVDLILDQQAHSNFTVIPTKQDN